MSQRVPQFLLNGLAFKNQFFGLRTIQTTSYAVFEIGVRVAPIFIVIGYAGKFTSPPLTLGQAREEQPCRSSIRRTWRARPPSAAPPSNEII